MAKETDLHLLGLALLAARVEQADELAARARVELREALDAAVADGVVLADAAAVLDLPPEALRALFSQR